MNFTKKTGKIFFGMQNVVVQNISIGESEPLSLICGPCVIESEDQILYAAHFLKDLCDKMEIPLIFKSSYDKANRSSSGSFRGPGLDRGLFILERVKKEYDLPILTDVHSPKEALAAGQICDAIQIPAFLCRQTDLLLAAGATGKLVNVKKGQFLAPWDMKNVVEKIESTGNKNILLTERGYSFGYNNLISDMRAIPIMQGLGYPVCFDATHSVQLPGSKGTSSGGENQFVAILAQAAVAAGANSLFIEVHENPHLAQSDASSQIPFKELEGLLTTLKRLYEALHQDVEAHAE